MARFLFLICVTLAALCDAKPKKGRKLTSVQSYRVLGPFPVGKNEIDGDPVEAFGGIRNAASDGVFPSEIAPKGLASWTKARAGADQRAHITFPVDWNGLVRTTSSMEVLEWQGWAVGVVNVDVAGKYAVRCLGVTSFELDDHRPLAGDIYMSGRVWHTIHLEAGSRTFFAKLRAKVQMQLECSLRPAGEHLEIIGRVAMPDIVGGQLMGSGLIAVFVTNFGPTALTELSASLDVPKGSPFSVSVASEQPVNGPAQPGQTLPWKVRLQLSGGQPSVDTCAFSGQLRLSPPATPEWKHVKAASVTLSFRCRKRKNQVLTLSLHPTLPLSLHTRSYVGSRFCSVSWTMTVLSGWLRP